MFLSRTVRSIPSTGLAIDWNTTFTKADGTSAKLMDIVGNFQADIISNLQKIKFRKILTTATQNEFVRIPESNVYVYQHKDNVAASGVELESFGRICEKGIGEKATAVFRCDSEECGHDDDLLPFFHSNPELLTIYPLISNNVEEPQPRKDKIQRYLNCISFVEDRSDLGCSSDQRRFHADNYSYVYAEDTWTKRLFEAVSSRYQSSKVEYTAPFRGRSCMQAVLKRMPKGTPIDTLMFRGSPDIIMKHKPVMIQDGSSYKFTCIETKKSLTMPYLSTSMIPQQAGQVICYIHQLLVAEILNKFVAGQVTDGAIGHGLYIMGESGSCILFEVSLTENPLSINAKVLYGVHNRVVVLCTAIDHLNSCE